MDEECIEGGVKPKSANELQQALIRLAGPVPFGEKKQLI
jgi:hypothetical protein